MLKGTSFFLYKLLDIEKKMACYDRYSGYYDSPSGLAKSCVYANAETQANSPIAVLDFSNVLDDSSMLSDFAISKSHEDCEAISHQKNKCQTTVKMNGSKLASKIPKLITKSSAEKVSKHCQSKIPLPIGKKLSHTVNLKQKSLSNINKTVAGNNNQMPMNSKKAADNNLTTKLPSCAQKQEKAASTRSPSINASSRSATPRRSTRVEKASPCHLGLSPISRPAFKSTAPTTCCTQSLDSVLRLDDLDLDLLQEMPAGDATVARLSPLSTMRHIRKLEEKFDRACLQVMKLNRRIEAVQTRYRQVVVARRTGTLQPLKVFLAAMTDARDAFIVCASQIETEMSHVGQGEA